MLISMAQLLQWFPCCSFLPWVALNHKWCNSTEHALLSAWSVASVMYLCRTCPLEYIPDVKPVAVSAKATISFYPLWKHIALIVTTESYFLVFKTAIVRLCLEIFPGINMIFFLGCLEIHFPKLHMQNFHKVIKNKYLQLYTIYWMLALKSAELKWKLCKQMTESIF